MTMKLLMLADTHGECDLINRQMELDKAEACIHCGDMGFFTDESLQRLPQKELRNLIIHSTLTREEQLKLLQASLDTQRETIANLKLLGNFQEYLNGEKSFDKPVYAVWGNHEDLQVINRLRSHPIHNLTILDETTTVILEGIRFYGLGGDCNEKYLTLPKKMGIPVVRGQIRTAFWQIQELMKTLDRLPQDEGRIQITHAFPPLEPILHIMANAGRAQLTFSGHMHAPKPVLNLRQDPDDTNNTLRERDRLSNLFPTLNWKRFLSLPATATLGHVNLPAKQGMVVTIHDGQVDLPELEQPMLPTET